MCIFAVFRDMHRSFSIVEISLPSDRSLNTSISRGVSWHVCAIASSARSMWSSHMASNSICDVVLVCALMGAKGLLAKFCMRMVQVFLIVFVFVAAACIVPHANERCGFFERGNSTVGFACG